MFASLSAEPHVSGDACLSSGQQEHQFRVQSSWNQGEDEVRTTGRQGKSLTISYI